MSMMAKNKHREAHPEWFDEKGRPHVWVLLELIDYNPETGHGVWKKRGVKWFDRYTTSGGSVMTPAAQAHRWNGIYAGKDCFLSHGGRVMVCLFGKRLSAARVCCAISDGRYPAHCAFVGAFDDLRRVNIHTSDDRRIKAETIKIAGSIFYEKLEGRYSVALRHYGLNYKFGLWMDRSDAEAALTWGRHELITGRPGHEADDLPDGWDFNLAKSLERMKLSERRWLVRMRAIKKRQMP